MSPRRTRRAAVREGDHQTPDKKAKPSPKAVRSSRRTTKSTKNSDDSDVDHGETSRLDATLLTPLNNESTIINESTTAKRRKTKANDTSTIVENSLAMDMSASKSKSRSRKTTSKQKKSEIFKVPILDFNSLISEDEDSPKKRHKSQESTPNLMSDDEDEVPLESRLESTLPQETKTPDKTKNKKDAKQTIKVSEEVVTPLSNSPAPKRPKKTPRKSVLDVASSNSDSPLKSIKAQKSDQSNLMSEDEDEVPLESRLESTLPPENQTPDKRKNKKDAKQKVKLSEDVTLKSTPLNNSPAPKRPNKTPRKTDQSNLMSEDEDEVPLESRLESTLPQENQTPDKTKNKKDAKQKIKVSEEVLTPKSAPLNNSPSLKRPNKTPNSDSPLKSIKTQKSVELNLISEDEDDVPLETRFESTLPHENKTPDRTSSKKDKKRKTKVSDKNVTPKSSPLNVSLTPHRSTKTPRKSPMNLSSPKTHSDSPLKLMKTPRKLPVTVSPTSSEISSQTNTPPKVGSGKKFNRSALVHFYPEDDELFSISPKMKNRPIFSKSPKIVFKTPKKSGGKKNSPKSSGNKKQKNAVSASKVKKSPVKLPAASSVSPSVNRLSMSPMVMLHRLSISTINGSLSKPIDLDGSYVTPSVNSESIKLTVQNANSAKRPKTVVKCRLHVSPVTPLRPLVMLSRKGSLKNSPEDDADLDILKPLKRPIDESSFSMMFQNTSTPRERTKRALNSSFKNLSPEIPKSPSEARDTSPPKLKSTSTPKLQSPSKSPTKSSPKNINAQLQNNDFNIDDESEPSLNGSSLIHLSGLMDSDESQLDGTFKINKAKKKSETDEKNNTYELEQPKTPSVQRALKRHIDNAAGLNKDESEPKKQCRVRFASPELDNNKGPPRISRIGTPGHALQKKNVNEVGKAKVSLSRISMDKIQNNTGARSRSVTRTDNKITLPVQNKRRSNSTSAVSRTPHNLSKPKVLESDKKSETKAPSARKVPNFAEIHQKNFAKMESLVDAKKRLVKRHEDHENALTPGVKRLTTATDSAKKVAPSTHSASGYNRFGFKVVRKTDAVAMVAKKHTPISREKKLEQKREQARSVLKGVRMNRRFELQMQARNKTS